MSFYVVASYWLRHRRLMRHVTIIHPVLVRDTLVLLFIVAAMPFPTSLLGRYGSQPISLVIYGATNAVAVLTLMVLSRDIRRLQLRSPTVTDDDYGRSWQTWLSLGVFILCVPAGYVLGHNGPYVLVLLAVPDRVALVMRLAGRRRRSA